MTDHIRKVLDLSSDHIPPSCRPLTGADGVVAYRYELGWLMWVPNDPAESANAEVDEIDEQLLDVQLYARSLDCDYVMFDRDGDVNNNLPTWSW